MAAERITAEWLVAVGIYPSDAGKKRPDDPPREFHARVVGGSDNGWKKTSDEDEEGDEISELVIVLDPPCESVSVCVETYVLPTLNTVALVDLGVRHTRAEILALCRALKAWAIKYDDAEKGAA